MPNSLLTNHFLLPIEAIVFGSLAYFLWMYYRGFGRQYVKLWTMSNLALSIYYLSQTFLPAPLASPAFSNTQLLLLVIEQAASFIFLFTLGLGLYCAQAKYYFETKILLAAILLAIAIASLIGYGYALNADSLFNRFYLRVSLNQFISGCLLISYSVYLFTRPRLHFSSRILSIINASLGASALLYSFISIAFTRVEWLQKLVQIVPFIHIGAFTILGFSILMWIYGAERNAANQAISKAQYLGQHDALTGLLNREQVLEKLPPVMQQVTKGGAQLAIFLLDIKRFKFINDTYGLKTGDYILGEIGHRLTNSILLPAVIGRLSGDSFLFALELHKAEQIQQAIEHLHDLIDRPYFHQHKEVNITASLGYCLYPQDGEIAEDLLQKANLALFHAESDQKLTMQFQEGMQDKGRHLLQIEHEIHQALHKDEFELYFQPQLNLFTNRLEGVEALIRWQHPTRGLLPPKDFLPAVEALGLNSKLDNYVLVKSCQAIARWYQLYRRRVTIAINLTAVEFQDDKLISTLQSLLFQYNIPPKCLDLEITENVVMTDIDSAMTTIITLQNMGIKVSIDDFGTGYSSLAYLRALPIDKIKIDRSFIIEMAKNDSDLTIVKSMIELSHGLGKRVLAEGVETVEQLNILKGMGCDAIQGYFISRPIPEQALAKYLKRK
jgi:diguanylate cyclase